MKIGKLLALPLLFVLLCGSAEKTQLNDSQESTVSSQLVSEEFDLMDFPARPECFSVNEQGQVAVGYQQAGRPYFSIIEDGRIVVTYHVEMQGSYQIQLCRNTLIIYPSRAVHEVYLDLKTGVVRIGQLSDSEKYSISKKLRSQDRVTCGNYELVSQVVKGHYQLQLNGKTVLQCSLLITHLEPLLFITYAGILCTVVFRKLYKYLVGQTPKPPADKP